MKDTNLSLYSAVVPYEVDAEQVSYKRLLILMYW